MANIIHCPFCHAPKSVPPNTQTNCSNCGARLHVGNDGKVHKAVPKKSK
ncbi:MAG: hypothetical protein IJR94_05645 [Synergistaceae bacterium]|nr:hypothetical protein [Synergistaceae bacterium]